jgi:hypothetical protein
MQVPACLDLEIKGGGLGAGPPKSVIFGAGPPK